MFPNSPQPDSLQVKSTRKPLLDSPSGSRNRHATEPRAVVSPPTEVVWRPFDRDVDTLVTYRNRPHWDQPGALTFLTCRLADSMPEDVLRNWDSEQREWLDQHGFGNCDLADVLQSSEYSCSTLRFEYQRRFTHHRPTLPEGHSSHDQSLGYGLSTGTVDRRRATLGVATFAESKRGQDQSFSETELRTEKHSAGGRTIIPESLRRQFLKFRRQRWHENLDACRGSCILRQPEIAMLVAESLLNFEGERYDLERFVILPNHVHLLVQMRAGWSLRGQCEGWLRFTARQINRILGRKGEFWQSEPFDHIVRSEEQFLYLQQYVLENPQKASLNPGEFLLWIRDSGFCSP